MASINTVPLTSFPQEVEVKLVVIAQNQEDLDYIKTELVEKDLKPVLQDDFGLTLKSHTV